MVSGHFERGDTVRVLDPSGREVARGLANYAAVDIERIRGERSNAIGRILGFDYGEEIIHRNNMVLL
jgi:glutamate 5-kinase